jgi:Fur family transcriptional regulator, zinc uptake regulator
MNTYVTHGINLLRSKGFRITTARQQVLAILSETEAPLSPYDVVDYMSEKNQKTDAITVYRIFDCLEQNGLIHRILSSGKFVKCRIEAHTPHSQHQCCHHIAICDGCGTTREIHCHAPIHIPPIPDMIITGHRLELIGRCTSCQERFS